MLCQIEKCCRYAEKTNRTVIVDANYQNSRNFHEDFSHYFQSRQNKLFLSLNDSPVDLEQLNVYPPSLQGKLNSYQVAEKMPLQPFKEMISGEDISFDFSKHYPHSLLVHHQGGGGNLSAFALLRLKLVETVKSALISRLAVISGSYTAIHIRHTDYHSEYLSAIQLLKDKSPARLFVASDNRQVLDEIFSHLPSTKIFSFSKNISIDGSPIHQKKPSDETLISARNLDAVLDLLTLALSSQLIICKISGGTVSFKTPNYSGYSLLAKQLWENKLILNYLLKPSKIKFGLD